MKNPFLGSMVAKAAIDGIQGDDMSNHSNLVVCAKHYMGYCASEFDARSPLDNDCGSCWSENRD